jgi:hypothetical protein
MIWSGREPASQVVCQTHNADSHNGCHSGLRETTDRFSEGVDR